MVLDPFSALSLAGVVVQFVDFSAKIFSETQRLYKCSGCKDEHEEIDCINQDISRICSDIAKAASRREELFSDPSLQSLIVQCQGLSKQLSIAIGGAAKDKTHNQKWKSFREALKRIWNQDRINEFRRRLSYLQEQLTLHLQTSQSKLLHSMNESMGILKGDTKQLIDLHYENSQLLKSTIHSLEQIRLEVPTASSISDVYEALVHVADPERERRTRVLRSLSFGYMTSRYLNITEAHVQTFQWVFSSSSLPETDPRSNVLFTQWLQSGTGTYWISGKAGSGKSTLMKYLADHSETTAALEDWSGACNLNIAKFFFWNSGTSMQKSQLGLLQSLVFEILLRRPEWIPAVCPSRWSSDTTPLTEWDMSELKSILRQLVRQEVSTSAKFCFFIDGLDEYDGNTDDILECLQHINCSTHVKLCLSSRPWNCFEDSLGKRKDQKLYMEQLTREDIEKYAYERISSFMRRYDYIDAIETAEGLCKEITNKAEGVFLWVALAVSSLRRGITNRDSVCTLYTRLHKFPPELRDFFHHILDQVEDVYTEKMFCLFKVALECHQPMSVYAYSILMNDNPEFGVLLPRKGMTSDEIERRVLFAERQLDGCCKGLLEVQLGPGDDAESGSRKAKQSKFDNGTVGFLHLTVRDFLLEEYTSWQKHLPGSFCPHVTISRALIGEMKTMHPEGAIGFSMEETMLQACVKAEEKGTMDCRVLDQLDSLKMSMSARGDVQRGRICSTEILETAIDRGIPSYIRSKASEGLFETRSQHQYLLGKAFKDLGGLKRLEIIEALLNGGADPAGIRSDRRLAELMSCNATDWGSPSHALIVQPSLSGGVNVNVRNMGLLAWAKGVMENLQKRPADCTLRMLRQYFKYAADPNDRYDERDHRSVWEIFLDRLYSIDSFNIADGYVDHIEEFLRHGADPFVAGFGPLRNLSLMDLVGQCFSYNQSRRLGTLLSEEMEDQRTRRGQRPGILHMAQDGTAGDSKRKEDSLPQQMPGGSSERSQKRRRTQI